ncbi:hypothetical protein ACEE94_10535 [Staphylococcus epidermidis]
MLSTTIKNMSEDLEKNNHINDYLDEIPNENKVMFLDTAINELKEYITLKTKRVFKSFYLVFIVATLISIVAMLFFQPAVQGEFQRQNLVHEKVFDLQSKDEKKLDDAELERIQGNANKSVYDLYSKPVILYSVLAFGLLFSLFAFIIPLMILSLRRISLKKYNALLGELQEQRYLLFSQKDIHK